MMRILGYIAFLLAYYAPIYTDLSGYSNIDSRATKLITDSISTPPIAVELVKNLLAHILLTALFYATCLYISRHAAKHFKLPARHTSALIVTLALVALFKYNSTEFPLSQYQIFFSSTSHITTQICTIIFLISSIPAALYLLKNKKIIIAILATSCITLYGFSHQSPTQSKTTYPNIIIIGIDSLSNETLTRASKYTPTIAKLFSSGTRFSNAYTNIGRTLPSWSTILSGALPSDTGAIFNLRDLNKIETSHNLPTELKSRGYQTVFAIDERRFANIDESFGFDLVIGPKTGVLDFLVQIANDTPLTNLALQASQADVFLPFSRINVAAKSSYDANGFVEQILSGLRADKPLFLAAHFESAHFPYSTRHATTHYTSNNEFYSKHIESLTAVDLQIRNLTQALQQRGYLNDAIVVILADHGESFGEPEFAYTKKGESKSLETYGHGTSVLSELQNHIPLSLIKYVDGKKAHPETVETTTSLREVRHMIKSVANGELYEPRKDNCFIVETGIRFKSTENYKEIKQSTVASEAFDYYRITSEGLLALREDQLQKLVEMKDVGLRCDKHITYYDSLDKDFFSYDITERGLTEKPAPREDIEEISTYRNKLLYSTTIEPAL